MSRIARLLRPQLAAALLVPAVASVLAACNEGQAASTEPTIRQRPSANQSVDQQVSARAAADHGGGQPASKAPANGSGTTGGIMARAVGTIVTSNVGGPATVDPRSKNIVSVTRLDKGRYCVALGNGIEANPMAIVQAGSNYQHTAKVLGSVGCPNNGVQIWTSFTDAVTHAVTLEDGLTFTLVVF